MPGARQLYGRGVLLVGIGLRIARRSWSRADWWNVKRSVWGRTVGGLTGRAVMMQGTVLLEAQCRHGRLQLLLRS